MDEKMTISIIPISYLFKPNIHAIYRLIPGKPPHAEEEEDEDGDDVAFVQNYQYILEEVENILEEIGR